MASEIGADQLSNRNDGLTLAELLAFYKALSEPTRLRIAGLLAAAPATPSELSDTLGIPGSAVNRHLAQLTAVGVAREDYPGRYRLDEDGMRASAKLVLDTPRSRERAGATDERSKVLASFFRDGVLQAWPAGDQRKLILLREIVQRFGHGRTYTEREVNDLLKPLYADYTTIRRALIDYRLMNRDHSVYWLVEDYRQESGSDDRGAAIG